MFTNAYKSMLRKVASDYDAASQELFGIARRIEGSERYNPGNELYSLVRVAETNAVQLRTLAARVMGQPNTALNEEISQAQGIRVEEEHRWIKIVVPAILPNRNTRDNTLFTTRPLRHSLIQFQRENPMERFSSCVICIVHKYDEALGLNRVRDYDNIETKRYLDVIESVMLTNDSGLLCTILQTTQISDRDCTEFYLMLPESLPVWASAQIKSHTGSYKKIAVENGT